MLALKLYQQEYIVLVLPDGREVKVTLLGFIGTTKATLGFDAPPDVKIYRQEVYERMER